MFIVNSAQRLGASKTRLLGWVYERIGVRDPIPEDYASAKRSGMGVPAAESYFSLTDLSIAASAEETSKSGTDGIQEKFSEDLVAGVAFHTELATTIIQKATFQR